MRHAVLLVVAGALLPFQVGAKSPVTFSGALWKGGKVALEFENRVEPGARATMLMHGGRTIEMTVDDAGQAVVRLLARDGEELHSSAGPPDEDGTRSFMYALCPGGRVAFTSPGTPATSGCGEPATSADGSRRP